MSWLSDLFGEVPDNAIGPLITAGTSLIGAGGNLYQNSQNQDQLSKQWDAQFAYQQSRDSVNDAFNQAKLQEELSAAGMMAGAQVKAAGIAAGAQNRRTLSDLYGNFMTDVGGQAKNTLQGYSQLGSAISDPYLRRSR